MFRIEGTAGVPAQQTNMGKHGNTSAANLLPESLVSNVTQCPFRIRRVSAETYYVRFNNAYIMNIVENKLSSHALDAKSTQSVYGKE